MNQILKFLIKVTFWMAGIGIVTPIPAAVMNTPLWPTGFYIGVDMARFFYNFFEKKIVGCPTDGIHSELNASFDIRKVIIEGDWGFGTINRKNGSEKQDASMTKGYYHRIGVNYNLLSNTRHKNMVFWGIRYAQSFFEFGIQGQENFFQCPQKESIKPIMIQRYMKNVDARWWEIVGGGKVKVCSLLYIGCTFRYKFAKKIYFNKNSLSHVLPFDILGWGLAENEDCFGCNIYLTLRIPLYNDLKKIHCPKTKEKESSGI